MEVSVFTTAEDIEAARGALDILAQNAVETNVSNEWWALAPALRFLNFGQPVVVAVVWEDAARETALGLFCLERFARYAKLPIPFFGLWRHYHSMLATPLLRRGREQECLAAFFRWAESLRPGPLLLNFAHITADGPFFSALRHFADSSGRRWHEVAHSERAFLTAGGTVEEYLKQLRKKRRKELKRLARRLEEQGRVEVEVLAPGAPQEQIQSGVEEFLALEAKGWKGREGTAILSRENEKAFFLELMRNGADRGALSLIRLSLNGSPIAIQCNLHAGDGAFTYKITFDEQHAHCSPGILVAFENLRWMLERSGLAWMDSGAEPDHPMIDRLWVERRKLGSYNVELKRPLGTLGYHIVFLAKRLYIWLGKLRPGNNKPPEGTDDEQSED